jgi:D-threonate/D-erythronate kinase
MLLVVADDLTGAAEMAGIAWRYGLSSVVVRDQPPTAEALQADVVVLDTDSRLLSPAEAAWRTQAGLSAALQAWAPDRVFKKADSACRGPLAAEAEACIKRLNMRAALLVVASPATRRQTIAGVHYAGRLPLAESEFGRDPTHPITESFLPALFRTQSRLPVNVAAWPSALPPQPRGLIVGDACTDADIEAWAEALPEDLLPVGSAAFGGALLRLWSGRCYCADPRATEPCPSAPASPVLIVAGSLSETSGRQLATFAQAGGAVVRLTASSAATVEAAADALGGGGVVALASRGAPAGDGNATARLAEAVVALVGAGSVGTLILEGGHTAGTVLRRLGWSVLPTEAEIEHGIVALTPPLTSALRRLVLKPGSYGSDDLYLRLLAAPDSRR